MARQRFSHIAESDLAIAQPMARTDGRTNGRLKHLPEISSVADRAREIEEMRVLTVRQPWAWAIIHGGKDVENRVRNVAGVYRGAVAIHVAGKYAESGLSLPALDEACDEWCAVNGCGDHPWFRNVGKIIGVVDLGGVHNGQQESLHTLTGEVIATNACSPWAEPDAWHLELANPRPLVQPIPYRGALGLRRLPDDVAAVVRLAVAS